MSMTYSYHSDEDYLSYLARIQLKESINHWISLLVDAELVSLKQATKIISRVIEHHLTNTYLNWNKPDSNLGKALLIDTLKNHCKRMEINHEQVIAYLLLAE
jgi:hypothetical protein